MDALMLPSNWQKVRLGDIAEINPPTIIPNVFYYIDLESVEKGQLLNKQLMIKNKAPSRARRLLSKNDILYQLVRPYQRNNYFFTLNGNYVASTGYAQIRTLQNPSFLYFALHSNYFVNAVLDRCEGTSYPAISSNELKKCEVILPPLNEQAAIANILSDVDRYLYSLDALILKKESVKKALSFELLSQRKRLKGFNQAWQRVRLGDICEIVKGQQINKISLNNTDKYPVINGGIDFLGYTNKFNVSKNTIAISEGGTCGYVRFMKSDFWSGGHNYSLQKISNKVNNLCLYHILKSYEKDIMKLGVGSGLKNIQLKALKDFEILLPPLNEQIAIANILSDLDHEIISLKNKKRQFENIKKALNHDLMSAKIRVLNK
ncbi:restriction endonuclease subunit S [Helicobacter pylori]|uniref:restriction endonuclease subunit S n=3 Tax=Helicobacter pylori TaxID=210 RepID=UPI000BE8EB03|nr:restriction endonuclease subunit S [Helicobacter pylori]PDX21141.1 type I restriction endonuclease subunit S [Helicobacter pylori]WQU66550.1 restriction endonuclease subunit S [Helicobacter pylori]